MGNLDFELQDWLEMLRANNTEETIRHYRAWAQRFEDWLEMEPGRDALAGFDEFLRDGDALSDQKNDARTFGPWDNAKPPRDGYSYSSRIQAASAVKSWIDFRYGVTLGDRQMNQVQNIVHGERPDFDPVVASVDEIRAVLEDTRDCRADSCHAMTVTGYDAITRSIELCQIGFDDLDLDRGTVYIRGAKGSASRHIGLHDSTLDILADYRELVLDRFDDPQYLFYSFYQHWWNKPWNAHSWGQHFRKNHWDAGWHSFGRHTAITRRLHEGESLDSVNQRARHSTLKMTSRYNQLAGNGSSPLPELG